MGNSGRGKCQASSNGINLHDCPDTSNFMCSHDWVTCGQGYVSVPFSVMRAYYVMTGSPLLWSIYTHTCKYVCTCTCTLYLLRKQRYKVSLKLRSKMEWWENTYACMYVYTTSTKQSLQQTKFYIVLHEMHGGMHPTPFSIGISYTQPQPSLSLQ